MKRLGRDAEHGGLVRRPGVARLFVFGFAALRVDEAYVLRVIRLTLGASCRNQDPLGFSTAALAEPFSGWGHVLPRTGRDASTRLRRRPGFSIPGLGPHREDLPRIIGHSTAGSPSTASQGLGSKEPSPRDEVKPVYPRFDGGG